MMKEEVTKHLTENIIPFWKGIKGRYLRWILWIYGLQFKRRQNSRKGMYFKQQNHLVFANAYILLKDETLLDEARTRL